MYYTMLLTSPAWVCRIGPTAPPNDSEFFDFRSPSRQLLRYPQSGSICYQIYF